MDAISKKIAELSNQYAKAMQILHEHSGTIYASEALAREISNQAGVEIKTCISTHEYKGAPADSPECITVRILAFDHQISRHQLVSAIQRADLPAHAEIQRSADCETVIFRFDQVEGIELHYVCTLELELA
jgi:hypothetical protein